MKLPRFGCGTRRATPERVKPNSVRNAISSTVCSAQHALSSSAPLSTTPQPEVHKPQSRFSQLYSKAVRLHSLRSRQQTYHAQPRSCHPTVRLIMAIFPDVPGLQAEIVVDGEPLREYEDDGDDTEPGTVTKYIEALSDKEFVLKYTVDVDMPTDYGVEAKIDVDGKKCHIGIPPGDGHKPHYRYGPGHFKDGKYFRQHYRFTALEVGERLPSLLN
jgi:hypothetical protein